MEHYYIITGNEFGADISNKLNFQLNDYELADKLFDNLVKSDEHFYVGFYYVNKEGEETIIQQSINN